MKATLIKVSTCGGLVALLAGCYSPDGRPDNTASGALIGGASGATIGALVDRRNPGAGALIGGAAGLIAGGLVGHSVDEQNEARRQYYSAPPPAPVYVPAPAAQPLTIDQVKAMTKSGVTDDNIIVQINNTHTVYHLDANAIIDLSSSGVSQKVISYMINTSNATVSQAPPTPVTETVVAAPGPNYTYVSGEYVWNGFAWVWVRGRWVVGPYPHAVWVGARWDYGPYGWHRVPGYWR
ncbi:MAG TPA: YMGG-like glycine zipper-containing protein [Verrucomicrobiae bacterium]|jgi:hypothetical protein|nr:YMGG-like glycine zipper-containing protein [Verrucomicrobiae bacterium]